MDPIRVLSQEGERMIVSKQVDPSHRVLVLIRAWAADTLLESEGAEHDA
jgi:hypothetical protein